MMKITKSLRRMSLVIVFALLVSSCAGIGTVNTQVAQAEMTAGNIVYGGNGELSCNNATLTLKDGILKYSGAADYTYCKNPDIGTMVINQKDRLGHPFYYAGVYIVIDMETGLMIQAFKNSNGYCLESSEGAYPVKGDSSYMSTINTVLINDEYFYQNNMGMQKLMTREEFDKIISGQDPSAPTQTPEPTLAPTLEPTAVPTLTPTLEPTVEPTQAPTQAPTLAPTQAPKPVPTFNIVQPLPTRTPDIQSVTETHTKFDIDFWWEKYIKGEITWEQFTQIVWGEKWKVETTEDSKSTTYYFYDEEGKLIRTETIEHKQKVEEGNGSGSAQVENKGEAQVQIQEQGKGGATGTIDTYSRTDTYVNNPNLGGSKKKASKPTYSVVRSPNGKVVKLIRTVNGKKGVVCRIAYSNKKKGKIIFDGITYKKVKTIGFTADSRQIILTFRNGVNKIIPRGKGKIGKTYKAKKLKGKWNKQIMSKGFTVRVSNTKTGKVKGVKKAQPTKIKKASKKKAKK